MGARRCKVTTSRTYNSPWCFSRYKVWNASCNIDFRGIILAVGNRCGFVKLTVAVGCTVMRNEIEGFSHLIDDTSVSTSETELVEA